MDQRILNIMRKIRSPEQAVWNTEKVVDTPQQSQNGMAPNVGGIPVPGGQPTKEALASEIPPMQRLNPELSLESSALAPSNSPMTEYPKLETLIRKSNASRKNFLTGG